MQNTVTFRTGLISLLAMAAVGAPYAASQAQDNSLEALNKMTPGSWEIRYRPDGSRQRVCIRDGRDLIQLRHPQGGCSRYIVEDTANRATVHYTCRGHGSGRTQIRLETPQIAQIESQGILDGSPFQFSAEARRLGKC
ncbi:hypothetical protein NT2_05_00050 [Caenibius tardaugens NBRC 16725]|uniref:DUF3617 family protein n=1 Tax=Caenibius tardaugens NBRC 16725 TaxID=1219035 RepID=U2ZUM6_9SPHN|nr:DUF3617 family protein [Caenibius tardaugens]AZI36452.1 hypothetical protein EGO55_11230 [Caenibius tardaugens NBRC 16725]GAD49084.1 hypothetical protein NT2_05_00050 [Caenibius tardaugens NBRC 16725]